jgi:RNA polymerase sigma-70 factor, ECF subfamily
MVKSTSAESASPALERDEQSDEGIVQAVLGGSTAVFEPLMRRYNERLYRTAQAITRDDREAKDVMQQAYVNASPASGSSRARRNSPPG